MITGKDPGRVPLARVAQTYPNASLLIVNHSTMALFEGPMEKVRELRVTRPPSLGDLRNLALEQAQGDYVITWDDDDWHGPERIQRQVAAVQPGQASVLQSITIVDLRTGEAGVHNGRRRPCGGAEGTILHPRQTPCRYRSVDRSEDTWFAGDIRKRHGIVGVPNDPRLYLRFYHGMNTWVRPHIMRQRTRRLTDRERGHVEQVLAVYRERMS
jgi:glycosyltransferase involved in cell wall biosynthesis